LFLDGVERAKRLGRPLTILFIDLDRFRPINDVFGHDAGNHVLREAAARIGRCVRDGDLVTRLGGDEFAVLLEGAETPSLVSTAADVIGTELGHALTIAGREVSLSASIGIALSPRDGAAAEDLLRRADLAMSQAKKAGGNHHR